MRGKNYVSLTTIGHRNVPGRSNDSPFPIIETERARRITATRASLLKKSLVVRCPPTPPCALHPLLTAPLGVMQPRSATKPRGNLIKRRRSGKNSFNLPVEIRRRSREKRTPPPPVARQLEADLSHGNRYLVSNYAR